MKNPIWVGITTSLLAAIAGAQSATAPTTRVASEQQTLASKYMIVLNADGSATMIGSDGSTKILPKSFLDTIRLIDPSKAPTFGHNEPCMGIARNNLGSKTK